MKKFFVDNLTGGSVRQGVVRLDFSEVENVIPDKEKDAKDTASFQYQPVHRLYIPIAGFAQAFQVMQKIKEGLDEQVKKVAQSETDEPIV